MKYKTSDILFFPLDENKITIQNSQGVPYVYKSVKSLFKNFPFHNKGFSHVAV